MKRLVSLVVCVALWSSVAFAQETTGAVKGTVTSDDGAPLPGVTVQVEDLERGLQRVAVSDRRGDFTLASLPPASYQMTATLQGFGGVRRPVRVELGRTVHQSIEMQVGAFTGEIEVTGEVPAVDVTSTVSGLTVDSDSFLSELPVRREASEIALLAPGTFAADSYWQVARFKGIFTPGQSFVSFSGTSFGETSYQVDGLNITNFFNMMGSSFVPMAFVDQVQVKTGGYEAEFGRSTGGVINMVTKSGTNDLRGAFSAFWEPEDLQEQEPDTFHFSNQEGSRENLEVNASFGGPIVQDRLFFFAFGRYSRHSSTYVEDSGFTDLLEVSTPYWGGKLDWTLSSSHRLGGEPLQ